MKNLVSSLIALMVLMVVVDNANAQFVKAVSNPPGLFNRQVVRARGPGASVALADGRRGGAVSAAASTGGFVPANVSSAVAFGGVRTAFVPTGFVAAGFPANVAFNGSQVLFVDNNRVRFNAFGVSTVQDAFGNVFEVDAFGNARFAGNRLGSSAIVTGFVPSASAVIQSNGTVFFRGAGICRGRCR